jgi:hypothetical protein
MWKRGEEKRIEDKRQFAGLRVTVCAAAAAGES